MLINSGKRKIYAADMENWKKSEQIGTICTIHNVGLVLI
jgi:hypothetical protein